MTEVTPIEAGRAEARRRLLEGGTAELVGRKGRAKITVPEFIDWGDGALPALRESDFRGWASEALSEEDFRAWVKCAPTNRQVAEFFTAWKAASGEDVGESPAS